MSSKPTPVWITRDGTEIPIDKMTTQHILNAIKMIERDKSVLRQNFVMLEKFFGNAEGDIAEQMSDTEWMIEYTPYEHLKSELTRRKQNE